VVLLGRQAMGPMTAGVRVLADEAPEPAVHPKIIGLDLDCSQPAAARPGDCFSLDSGSFRNGEYPVVAASYERGGGEAHLVESIGWYCVSWVSRIIGHKTYCKI